MKCLYLSDLVDADATQEAFQQEIGVCISNLVVSGSPGSGKTCVVNLSVGEGDNSAHSSYQGEQLTAKLENKGLNQKSDQSDINAQFYTCNYQLLDIYQLCEIHLRIKHTHNWLLYVSVAPPTKAPNYSTAGQTWVKYKHEYSNYKYKYPVHG